MRLLADPRVRLCLGTAAVLVTALLARRDRAGHGEAHILGCQRPARLAQRSLWAIMQLGALGAVPAAALATLLAHDRELWGRLLAGATD
jgi:hypothetical protein